MNSIEKVRKGIEDFQQLFSSEKKESNKAFIGKLLIDAKYVNFGKVSFKENASEKIKMYLAYADENLYGVLIDSMQDFYKDPEITDAQFYVSSFSKNLLKINQNLIPKQSHPNQITYATLENRINNWTKNYLNWINESLAQDFLIEYFEIDASNFSSNTSNNCVFGLLDVDDTKKVSTYKNQFMFDLTVIADAYMDTVRPVPPFKP